MVFADNISKGGDMSVINITSAQKVRFIKVRASWPDDKNESDTFEHILKFYEQKTILPLQRPRIIPSNASSPIIDAEAPMTAEQLRKLAPTRGNEFIQIGGKKA